MHLPKINILSKHVSELIAAGEVIERPSSVVKELVENSMDASASDITVEIEHGGHTYIRITDNGCGIESEDLPTAFLRHATSKIKSEQDLDSIMSFGFRGEALASIAAVSHVTVMSRTPDNTIGYCINATDSEIGQPEECGCPLGTTILVRDLFYNTPARQKFLKKDITESNSIETLIDKIALSHPDIKFKFIRDGEIKLSTSGNGDLLSVISTVYGKDFSSQLCGIDYSSIESPAFRVHGFVTKPVNSRASRAYQNFYVNGRFVKTNTAMAALEEAFRGASMVGKYPGCVLFIDIPPEFVDVNVHPAKTEVRFQNEKPVFDLVYYGVKSSLNESDRSALSESNSKGQGISDVPAETFPVTGNRNTHAANEVSSKDYFAFIDKLYSENSRNDSAFRDNPVFRKAVPTVAERAASEDTSYGNESPVSKHEVNLKYIGELFKTYIILEGSDEVVFVDKHAAHERIIYEKLRKGIKAFDSQVLLSPLTATLSKEEYQAAVDNRNILEKFGFDTEDFGNSSILVRAIPLWAKESDIESLVSEISASIIQYQHDQTPEKLNRLYESIACRAAIKAHDTNSKDELDIIVKTLIEDEQIKYCPHGRPVSVKISKSKLEHMFGRIQ